MQTQIRLDTTQWLVGLASIGKKAPRAIVRAVNRTAENGQTVAVKSVAAEMGLKQAAVKEFVKIRKATVDRPVATIYASAKRVPLYDFKAKASKRGGVLAKLPTGAGKYPDLFIATMPTGHIGVFGRRGKKRLPITERHGPSVAQSYQRVEADVQARCKEQLGKNMAAEINYLTNVAAP